ncbi:hypothetical protein OHC33_005306 [Knufia fluminis]|uniref:Uncharacterized protein n=1 Tax=Knufia fluminis TaxID=191047 RepID=A0AAN8IMM7_9EURO|nr:hypothetical protein OHC33_005306 [Knufia fluminis]
MSSRRSRHDRQRVQEGEVALGDVYFLPKDKEAYLDVEHPPPKEVQGHPVVMIEHFEKQDRVDAEGSSWVWVLLVSSTTSKHHDALSPRHILFYGADQPEEPQNSPDARAEQMTYDTLGRRYMHLRDRNFMIKCCYLNADKIYELPLSALQHTTGQRRRLTYPSALHARRMAAEAIADALLRTTLYSGTFKSHMATFPPHVTAKWQNLEGLLCYVQPTDGMLEAPGGNAFFRAAGPCVIIQSYPTSCTVCLAYLAFASIQIITSGVSNANCGVHTTGPFLPLHVNTGYNHVGLSFTDYKSNLSFSFMPEQYLLCYPHFNVSYAEIYNMPDSYTMDRDTMHKHSLQVVRSKNDELAGEYDMTDLHIASMSRSSSPETSDSDIFYTPPTSPMRPDALLLGSSTTNFTVTAHGVASSADSEAEEPNVGAEDVSRGQILFLAKDGHAYQGVQCDVRQGIKGHFVFVLESFPNNVVWALVISSADNRSFDEDDACHVRIDDSATKLRSQEIQHICDKNCTKVAYLHRGHAMRKASYINATHVHEVPLSCLRRVHGSHKFLRPCSVQNMERLAACGIADLLRKSRLYNGLQADRALAISNGATECRKGAFCWVAPQNNILKVSGNNQTYGGSGPCIVVEVNQSTVKICMIVDRRSSRERWPRKHFRYAGRTNGHFERLACDAPYQRSGMLKVQAQKGLAFVNHGGTPMGSFLPDQSVMCYPWFEVSRDELYALPFCYRIRRRFMSDEGLAVITSRADELAKRR